MATIKFMEISEEEYKAFQASNERENNKAASSADELMKFKELLDSKSVGYCNAEFVVS